MDFGAGRMVQVDGTACVKLKLPGGLVSFTTEYRVSASRSYHEYCNLEIFF